MLFLTFLHYFWLHLSPHFPDSILSLHLFSLAHVAMSLHPISFLCFSSKSSSISHVFLYGQVFLLHIIHHPKSEYCCIPSLIPLNIQKYFFSSLSLFYSKVWWSLSLGLGQLQQWLQLQVFNNGACSLTPLFLIL